MGDAGPVTPIFQRHARDHPVDPAALPPPRPSRRDLRQTIVAAEGIDPIPTSIQPLHGIRSEDVRVPGTARRQRIERLTYARFHQFAVVGFVVAQSKADPAPPEVGIRVAGGHALPVEILEHRQVQVRTAAAQVDLGDTGAQAPLAPRAGDAEFGRQGPNIACHDDQVDHGGLPGPVAACRTHAVGHDSRVVEVRLAAQNPLGLRDRVHRHRVARPEQEEFPDDAFPRNDVPAVGQPVGGPVLGGIVGIEDVLANHRNRTDAVGGGGGERPSGYPLDRHREQVGRHVQRRAVIGSAGLDAPSDARKSQHAPAHASPRVPQSAGNARHGHLEGLVHPFRVVAAPAPCQQFRLEEMQRIEIGIAHRDRVPHRVGVGE